jgi:hypothetical protein
VPGSARQLCPGRKPDVAYSTRCVKADSNENLERSGTLSFERLSKVEVFRRKNRDSSKTADPNGAQGRNRTTDTVIFSHVLYQLSYLGAGPAPHDRHRAPGVIMTRIRTVQSGPRGGGRRRDCSQSGVDLGTPISPKPLQTRRLVSPERCRGERRARGLKPPMLLIQGGFRASCPSVTRAKAHTGL